MITNNKSQKVGYMEEFECSCSHCQQPLAVPDELMGQVTECPSCKGTMHLPPVAPKQPSETAPLTNQHIDKNRASKASQKEPVRHASGPAMAGGVPAGDVSPEAQAAAKRLKKKMNLWALAVMGVMFGLILIGLGWQNSTLRKDTEGDPKRMTLAELIKHGPGDSRYVELTNLIYGDQFWVEEKHGSWQGAWAFLFTEDDPRTPVAAAYLKDGGEKLITAAMEKDNLRGFVDKRKKFFEAYTGRQLYEMYPHVKTRDAEYFVRVVTWRPSQRGILITYGFGTGLCAIGLIFVGLAIMSGDAAPTRHKR